MNRITSLLFILFLLAGFSCVQNNSLSNNSKSGKVIEGLSLKGCLFTSDVNFTIYLSPVNEESNLFLLLTILSDNSE